MGKRQAEERDTSFGGGIPTMEAGKEYVNPKQEDQMEITGYCCNTRNTAVTWIFILLSAGILRLVFYWKPEWMLKCTHSICPLKMAEKVLLKDQYAQYFVETVETVTRDGTRVKVLMPKAAYSRKNRRAIIREDSEDKLELVKSDGSLRKFLVNKKLKYLWSESLGTYVKLSGLEGGAVGFFSVMALPSTSSGSREPSVTCSFFHGAQYVARPDAVKLRALYGPNSIPVHVVPVVTLVLGQVLNPFYIFQVFSMSVWFSDHYYSYAACILIISVVSIAFSVYTTRQMQRALKNTVDRGITVTVERDRGEFVTESSELLVPGDIIEVPRDGCIMQCDAVLISGNCIVNESMLTGESVPVTKTPLPNPKDRDAAFDMKQHSRHVLFCGTSVIQTRFYGNQKVRAVVIRTGFMTAKGELIRAIIFPKPVDFKFYLDTYKFLGCLALVAFAGMIYTLFLMVGSGQYAGFIVRRALDLVTIAVPPALPAALAVGIVMAQSRLKRHQIYCIQPSSINIAGSVNTVCFDKTGTLTEDGLDMWGVLPVATSSSRNGSQCSFAAVQQDMRCLSRGHVLYGLAACHSLTLIGGKLSGDPLDVKMFEATGWELEEPGEDTTRFDIMMPTVVRPPPCSNDTEVGYARVNAGAELHDKPQQALEIGIVRQFTFSSSLQRMSVIVRSLHANNFDIYVKGSPEMVASLSLPETVPADFYDVLAEYTMRGYRVIALAHRPLLMKYLKVQRVERADVEKDLEFLGLLIMENRLKPETTPVMDELARARIRTIMVTGDNMLTALSVARECGLVPRRQLVILVSAMPPAGNAPPLLEFHYAENSKKEVTEVQEMDAKNEVAIDMSRDFQFAMTGKSWAVVRRYFPTVLEKLVVRGAVYARMSPEQKAQLVEALQSLGYYVGMCGDGANDCGALKAAHTGISLSEADASVASPFTSRQPNISCVPRLMKEGRAALVTSFGIFKFIASYSVTQFTAVLILYWIGANLSDLQFLYQDLLLIMSFSITFGRTPAYKKLHKMPPLVNLSSLQPILSLFIVTGFVAAFQAVAYLWVQVQPWFEPFVQNDEEDYTSYENTAVFTVLMFQTIAQAIMFSKGKPYRKTMLRNYWFLANLLVLIALSTWIALYPLEFMVDLLALKPPPILEFRALLFSLGAGNIVLFLILDMFFLESIWFRRCIEHCRSCIAPVRAGAGASGRPDYRHIEEELLLGTSSWPPVERRAAGGIASVLQREASYVDLTAEIIDDGAPVVTEPRNMLASKAPVFNGLASNSTDQHQEEKETVKFDLYQNGEAVMSFSSIEGSASQVASDHGAGTDDSTPLTML